MKDKGQHNFTFDALRQRILAEQQKNIKKKGSSWQVADSDPAF
jgi:hypothetical protein